MSPDVVLVGIGVEMTFEVIAAAALLRKEIPALRVRVVNVTDLMILGPHGTHPHSLSDEGFESLFTKNKPVIFNYHGYPVELKVRLSLLRVCLSGADLDGILQGLLFGRPNLDRMTIQGYIEEGTTTSPFMMMLMNKTSRYDLAAGAVRGAALLNPRVEIDAHKTISHILHLAQKDREYILEHGADPAGMFDVPRFE